MICVCRSGNLQPLYFPHVPAPLLKLSLLAWLLCCYYVPLTLGQAESAVHPKSHQSVRLSAINHRVVSPQAQPVVGEQGDQVMGKEEQQTDAGQNHSDGFQIGPEHRRLNLKRRGQQLGSGCGWDHHILHVHMY